MSKQKFRIKITYFKESGKMYLQREVEKEFRDLANEDNPLSLCCMNDVVAWIRGLNGSGSSLPGLNGAWDYYILVDCEDYGYPCLILPRGMQ